MPNSRKIITELKKMFPNARCELNYHNDFELLIAVVLSAQTTDQKVNAVTLSLFAKYPDAQSLASADSSSVAAIIRTLGLANNKSKNIIELSKQLVEKHQGQVPASLVELIQLPGVGRKTANVVLLEAFKIPAIPVDTHVERVSKRLGLVPLTASVLEVERQLALVLPKSQWIQGHQLFIHFGRYFCKAIKPKCDHCPFIKECQKKELQI